MLPPRDASKPLKAVMGMDPEDKDFGDKLQAAMYEAGSPFFSSDVTFGFVQELYNNTRETGGQIF